MRLSKPSLDLSDNSLRACLALLITASEADISRLRRSASSLLKVAPVGFEPTSQAPEARMIGRYTTEL